MAQDYVVGTYFFGMGTAMIALSNTRYLNFPRASTAGALVLGIYASHMMFVDLLVPLNRLLIGSAVWSFTYVTLVFMASLLLAWLLARFAWSRQMVA